MDLINIKKWPQSSQSCQEFFWNVYNL